MNKQRLYILISSIIGVLAAFMPWATVSAFRQIIYNAAGIAGDGKITLVLFGIVCALCFVGNKQEKFTKQFEYGVIVLGILNIVVFLVLLINANEVVRRFGAFGNVSVAHGAYLTFLAALAVVLFAIEQLQLVNKVECLIKNVTGKKTATPTQAVVSVKEVVAVVENVSETEVKEVETVQESVVEDVDVQTETNQAVENAEETELTTVENKDVEELPSENTEA